MKAFGFNVPILIDRKGTIISIISGHGRYEAAKANGDFSRGLLKSRPEGRPRLLPPGPMISARQRWYCGISALLGRPTPCAGENISAYERKCRRKQTLRN
jgi:hypothetical protein